MKANYLQIIFITDNPLLSDGAFNYTKLEPEERKVYDIFHEGITAAASKVGIPVTVRTMSKYANLDSVDFEKWGIHRFPAVRLYAEYPGGKQAWYNLERGAFDLELDITAKEITDRLVFLYNGRFGEPSLVCQIFPPLCALSKWVWLGVAVVTAYKGTQAQGSGKYMWFAGAALATNEFLERGGLEAILKPKTAETE